LLLNENVYFNVKIKTSRRASIGVIKSNAAEDGS